MDPDLSHAAAKAMNALRPPIAEYPRVLAALEKAGTIEDLPSDLADWIRRRAEVWDREIHRPEEPISARVAARLLGVPESTARRAILATVHEMAEGQALREPVNVRGTWRATLGWWKWRLLKL